MSTIFRFSISNNSLQLLRKRFVSFVKNMYLKLKYMLKKATVLYTGNE